VSISKSEARLESLLNRLPAAPHYCIAYSGGVDSHVLLHFLASRIDRLQAVLTAVHVDHRIQPQSGDWAKHCRAVCAQLGVPFDVLQVDGRPVAGESPEAAARRVRYQALADWLPADAVLLTGQHRQDQAETLVLQLFRGAGPRGLAAMPSVAPFGAGRLARPLLETSRREILAYAHAQQLCWVEDPSNADTRYDRNLLRHELMPLVRRRWPAIDAVLARAAALQADQADLAAALAQIDLDRCQTGDQSDRLPVAGLAALSAARQRNLLRHWIETNGLPVPSRAVLQQVLDSVLAARSDANPRLQWPGAELRRYHDRLYIMPPLPPAADTGLRIRWNINESLALPGGTLGAHATTGSGVRAAADMRLEVGFRRGGEALRPTGRREHHTLKKLFQEWQVPAWERALVPLVFSGGELIAVADFCVCEGYQAAHGERGYDLYWNRTPNSAAVAL
jgi:tRNA(Ile)-lysidine synthase